MKYLCAALLALAVWLTVSGIRAKRVNAALDAGGPATSCVSGADVGKLWPSLLISAPDVFVCAKTGPGQYGWERVGSVTPPPVVR